MGGIAIGDGFLGDGAREEASEDATIALASESTLMWRDIDPVVFSDFLANGPV